MHVALSIDCEYLLFVGKKETNTMSEYDALKKKGLTGGRPRLSQEEREIRKELAVKKQEARRRALLVLQHRHADEYAKILAEELKAVLKK